MSPDGIGTEFTLPLEVVPPRIAPLPQRRFILLALVLGSGFSALVYEVVWLQLLQLVIGSTAVSLGVLLGTLILPRA